MHRLGVEHALVRGVVLAFVALVVGSCGGPSEPEPRPLPEDQQALRPGEYRSEEFEPSLSFRVGEGWTTSPPELYDALRITRGHETGGWASRTSGGVRFYKPTKTGAPYMMDTPKDVVGWFRRHPHLKTDEPEPVTVGGVKGAQFDVVVGNPPEDHSGECGSDCVDVFRFSSGGPPLALWERYKGRLIVLEDMGDETVIVGFASPAAEFDEHAPQAQKVLDTVQWRGE